MTETETAIAAIFNEAGWKPNWRAPDDASRLMFSQDCGGSGWNVGGVDPEGVMRWKNTALAPDSPDTPNDPVEAARVLVAQVAAGLQPRDMIPLADEATQLVETAPGVLEAPPQSGATQSAAERAAIAEVEQMFDAPAETTETPQDETHGETGAEAAEGADRDVGPLAEDDQRDGDSEAAQFDTARPEPAGHDPFDAEFWTEELNRDPQPLEADDLADLPQLEGLEPVDEEADTEDSDADASKYIFGDNLANDRLFRQGQITDKAELLIEQVTATVDGGDSDFADLQAYVVSNLNAAGAFVGQDQDKYRRFVELSDAKNRVAKIQQARAEKISFIRTAEREAVATFDPEADWPLF